MFVTVPSFDEPAATFAPTESAGSGLHVLDRDDERRRRRGPQLDLGADRRPETTWSRIATTVPSTGE